MRRLNAPTGVFERMINVQTRPAPETADGAAEAAGAEKPEGTEASESSGASSDKAFGDPGFVKYADEIPADAEEEDLKRFVRMHSREWESIFTALDGDGLSVKMHEVPFGDLRQFEKTLPLTLEDLLPFPLEGKFPTTRCCGREPNLTRTVIGVVDKSSLAKYLETMTRAGVEPRAVGIDGLALANLSTRFWRPRRRSAPGCWWTTDTARRRC